MYAKKALEYRNGHVAINPRHSKLVTSLRTAVENSEGLLALLPETRTLGAAARIFCGLVELDPLGGN
jgi:hypothetical protein